MTDKKPYISIVSPVYQSEGIVDELVKRITEEVARITEDFEIVLVETQTLYYKIHSSLGLNVDIYPTGHRFAGIV